MSLSSAPYFGIVTALPKELAAMQLMMDSSKGKSIDGDPNDYFIGTIPALEGSGKHTIVVALLKQKGMGAATAAAVNLLRSFLSIREVLMVGIAAGVPNPTDPSSHVRLGDVVVSDEYGLLAWDRVKLIGKRVQYWDSSPKPSAFMMGKVKMLEASRLTGPHPWEGHIDRVQALNLGDFSRPRTDVLFDCRNPDQRIRHPSDRQRRARRPRVHYGRIGSANALLRRCDVRDKLRDQYQLRAIEMESSGLADATWTHATQSYFVIRGISDYGDERKSDTWQGYAALAAAAYCRSLLETIPANRDPVVEDIKEGVLRAAELSLSSSLESVSEPVSSEAGVDRLVGFMERLYRATKVQTGVFSEEMRATYFVGEGEDDDVLFEGKTSVRPGEVLGWRALGLGVTGESEGRRSIDELGVECEALTPQTEVWFVPVSERDPRMLKGVVFFVPTIAAGRPRHWRIKYRWNGLWNPLRGEGRDVGAFTPPADCPKLEIVIVLPPGARNAEFESREPRMGRAWIDVTTFAPRKALRWSIKKPPGRVSYAVRAAL